MLGNSLDFCRLLLYIALMISTKTPEQQFEETMKEYGWTLKDIDGKTYVVNKQGAVIMGTHSVENESKIKSFVAKMPFAKMFAERNDESSITG